jgi:hypothetical protein
MFADAVRMERVLRKDLTYAAAAHRRVRAAHLAPGQHGRCAAAAAQARYPVVLKWADPNAMIPLLRQAGMRSRRRSTARCASLMAACAATSRWRASDGAGILRRLRASGSSS